MQARWSVRRRPYRADFSEICHEQLDATLTGKGGLRPAGLEPATPGLGNRCSILLSYGRVLCSMTCAVAAPPLLKSTSSSIAVRVQHQLRRALSSDEYKSSTMPSAYVSSLPKS